MEEKYINPHTDFGFKRLFGSEFNKELLISFLNAQELKAYEESMSVQEAVNTVGGISIIRVTGAMDGIKGNTEVFIFGIRVFHGKNVD